MLLGKLVNFREMLIESDRLKEVHKVQKRTSQWNASVCIFVDHCLFSSNSSIHQFSLDVQTLLIFPCNF